MLGQHVIHQIRRPGGHPAAPAARTEAPAAATERHQVSRPARVAVQVRKPLLRYRALKIPAQLFAHEPGQRPPLPGLRPLLLERPKVPLHHTVKRRVPRLLPRERHYGRGQAPGLLVSDRLHCRRSSVALSTQLRPSCQPRRPHPCWSEARTSSRSRSRLRPSAPQAASDPGRCCA